MQDQFARRCEIAIQQAVAFGARPWNANPPMDRLLRKLGLGIRPPHYRSFVTNLTLFGSFFALPWGIMMWFLFWSAENKPFLEAVISSAFAGIAFGTVMAALIIRDRRKAGWANWDDLPG